MKRFMIIICIGILASMAVWGQSQARVPRTMNIQGVLKDDLDHVLPNGNYTVTFMLWDAEFEGSDLWGETVVVTQQGGFFSTILGETEDFDPTVFNNTLWMSMQIEGDSEMEPRIQMTSVATALSAGLVDRGAAVLSLNGLKNNVILQGGANVTITQQDSTLTIAATSGAGGDDGDWLIAGNDVSHPDGRVYVGTTPALDKSEAAETGRDGEDGAKDPTNSRLTVIGENEGIYSVMRDGDTQADGRHALYAKRQRLVSNPGTGYGPSQINSAIMGYNDWGDSYTFGVAGYTWFDFNNTGAVLGSRNSGDYWGSLAFRDDSGQFWGMYTPNNLHVGGMTETDNLRMTNGATAGYILTSDDEGNAAWAAPAAATSDGDWAFSGNNLFNATVDAVAIGTSSVHPWGDSTIATTVQVKALYSPTLALDAQGIYPNNQLHRWTITGSSSGLYFNKSNIYDSYGTTFMKLTETAMEFNNADGTPKIRMETEADMDDGGAIRLYGATSTATTLLLDGNAGGNGGNILVSDGDGSPVITISANYNNSGVGRLITPVLEITGGSDLSEQFDIGSAGALSQPGMVVSIDPDNPGGLTLSGQAYDRKVAGVISGAGGINTGMVMGQKGSTADGEHPVALVGRVYVWADASSGAIEPGDLLTTSDRPGHAMKVLDHGQATGAILGKAMTGLTEGQGLILTLVTLQ